LAICATGTSTKDSLLSWIRLLEVNGNPSIGEVPVLFRFRSEVPAKAEEIESGASVPATSDSKSNSQNEEPSSRR